MILRATATSAIALAATLATAQDQATDVVPSAEATPEQERTVGTVFRYTMDQAGEPYAGPAVNNTSLTLERGDARLNLPDGFSATLFASGLDGPRQAYVLPNGDVLVSMQEQGYIALLRDEDGDGTADLVSRYAERFQAPYGIAYRGTEDGPQVLVADLEGLWTLPYTEGKIRIVGAEAKPAEEVPEAERVPQYDFSGQTRITPEGAFGTPPFGHVNRDIAIAPDGTLFVGIGSNGNISVEPGVPATIQAFEADGTPLGPVATGVRNPTGLAIHPETGQLIAGVQERDGVGDDLVPDFLIAVRDGGFYGWPYSYIGSNPQPGFADQAPDRVEAALVPDLLFQPHSAVMGISFPPEGSMPPAYSDGLFAALKGSWNRTQPTGYKVVFVPFEDGLPGDTYENFATGFWVSNDTRAEVWGRPSDVTFGPDGAMFIVDDTGKTVWRVTYDGAAMETDGETMEDSAAMDDAQGSNDG
ncbi:MAG: PQQ-dependent sugar dehydrogenase [Shimia sp.]